MDAINLLPRQAIGRYRQSAYVQWWVKTLFTATVLCSLAIAWAQLHSQQGLAKLDDIQAEAADLRNLRDQILSLKRELNELRKLESSCQQMRSAHSPVTLLSKLTAIKEDMGGFLEIEQMDYKEIHDAKAESQGEVKLQVVTDSPESSSRFIALLQQTAMFYQVSLTGALQRSADEHGDLRFAVTCQF